MSMSEDEYAYEEYMSELYEEHKKEAIRMWEYKETQPGPILEAVRLRLKRS